MAKTPRILWHDGGLWFYRYQVGGFEGYRSLLGRRLAPDLAQYGRRLPRWRRGN